jgi:hypothetical protein
LRVPGSPQCVDLAYLIAPVLQYPPPPTALDARFHDVAFASHAASGWSIHCGVEVTELSTNKQHTLSHLRVLFVGRSLSILTPCPGLSHYHTSIGGHFWWLLQPAFPSFTDLFHYFFADLCRTLNLNLKQTYTLNPCFTDLFLKCFFLQLVHCIFFPSIFVHVHVCCFCLCVCMCVCVYVCMCVCVCRDDVV